MGKRTELGMLIRPSKAKSEGKDGNTYQIGNAYSSIVSKIFGPAWVNVPNWECLFVHRKQGLGTKIGKRTELVIPSFHREQGLGSSTENTESKILDNDGKTYRTGNAYSSIESKTFGPGW